jgi:hypothetical protein
VPNCVAIKDLSSRLRFRKRASRDEEFPLKTSSEFKFRDVEIDIAKFQPKIDFSYLLREPHHRVSESSQ